MRILLKTTSEAFQTNLDTMIGKHASCLTSLSLSLLFQLTIFQWLTRKVKSWFHFGLRLCNDKNILCWVTLKKKKDEKTPVLRGAWRDRDTNDILLTAPLFFTFLTSNFPTLFVLLNFILWSGPFLKIPSGKTKYPKNHPKHLSSCSAFRNLFPKLCLILKEWFLTRFPPNFQERFLMSSASPEFVFWGPKIKQFCFKASL